jgi:outer membrane biosynthesis protein TonB
MRVNVLGCVAQSTASAMPRVRTLLFCIPLVLASPASMVGQAPKTTRPDVLQETANTPLTPAKDPNSGAITEDEIKQLVVGKTLYLRNGYLDNSLEFDEHGRLVGHSPQGSYTLCLVKIDKVRMTKRKVELDGQRYGLHFLGALPNEDPTKAVDTVKITPKKKVFKVTIDRELVFIPKKKKQKKGAAATPVAAEAPVATGSTSEPGPTVQLVSTAAEPKDTTTQPTPAVEQLGEVGSVTTTTSPAHAARLMREALDQIFSQGLDDRLVASLPTFWKLYLDAAEHQSDYRPTDPSIYRQNTVDQKAKLLTALEPPSNEFAQASGVAGMALYYAVIGADGKPQEVLVARPIGFGLDENAADTIRKASFQPAIKDGKQVPVLVDLVVQFRIFSNRTSQPGQPDEPGSTEAKLPGPYSASHP